MKNPKTIFPKKTCVRIMDNNNSPYDRFHQFLLPFSSKVLDLNRVVLRRRPRLNNTALITKTKLRVFGSNVKAVLSYGSETWRLTKRFEQKL